MPELAGCDFVDHQLAGVARNGCDCFEDGNGTVACHLTEFGVEFVPNDFFLTPRELFADWAGSQKSYVMENFYRAQRTRLGILMDGGKPEGGRWNFDAENREGRGAGRQCPMLRA